MVEFPQSVLAKYLIDSGVGVDGSGVLKSDDWTGNWYLTSDKIPDFFQNWIGVRHLTDDLTDKPVREQAYRTEYYEMQLTIQADTQPNGRTKGRQIADLIGRQMYNAVVVLDGRSYRLQNFSVAVSGLVYLQELERDRQQLFALNGHLTMWEI